MDGSISTVEEGLWEPEDIPDEDYVYRRVEKGCWKGPKEWNPGAFGKKPLGDDISVYWNRYSTPEQTAIDGGRAKGKFGIVKCRVGRVRSLDLQVEHTPINTPSDNRNRAHTSIIGVKDEERRVLLSRIAELVFPAELDPPKK
jgi:hypothetical protein